jgi:hypothetical protein
LHDWVVFVWWRRHLYLVKIVLETTHFRKPLYCFRMLDAHGSQKFWPFDRRIARSRLGRCQEQLGKIKRGAGGATIIVNLAAGKGIHIYIPTS